jgi:Arm DNA-binding domain
MAVLSGSFLTWPKSLWGAATKWRSLPAGGAGAQLRKYTIGPYGQVTLHQARSAAQKVFAARVDGRDPAAEKREKKRGVVADRVTDLLERFIDQRLSQNRSGAEIARLLRREMGSGVIDYLP